MDATDEELAPVEAWLPVVDAWPPVVEPWLLASPPEDPPGAAAVPPPGTACSDATSCSSSDVFRLNRGTLDIAGVSRGLAADIDVVMKSGCSISGLTEEQISMRAEHIRRRRRDSAKRARVKKKGIIAQLQHENRELHRENAALKAALMDAREKRCSGPEEPCETARSLPCETAQSLPMQPCPNP